MQGFILLVVYVVYSNPQKRHLPFTANGKCPAPMPFKPYDYDIHLLTSLSAF